MIDFSESVGENTLYLLTLEVISGLIDQMIDFITQIEKGLQKEG